MKQGIHPDYHKITVQMTDGTKYETRSTWGKEGDVLQLDVDPKTHPAWVGGINLRKTGQMEKFQNKFAAFDVAAKGAGKKEAAKAAANPKQEAKPKKEEKKAEKKEAAIEAKAEDKKETPAAEAAPEEKKAE